MGIPLTPGNCGGCETPIWEKDPKTGRMIRPLPNYREFYMVLSNERMAPHAICASCLPKLNDGKVKSIFERIRSTWVNQTTGFNTIEEVVRINKLQVVCWDFDEKEAEKKYYGMAS